MTRLHLTTTWARGWRALRAAVLAATVLCVAATTALAQNEPQFATWNKVEISEDAKKYFDQLKKGEFDASSKAFLERIALPQLAADGNRRQIERTRRKMRDTLLNEKVAEAGALTQAGKTAMDWLVTQARNPQADMAVRVNAMLLVGELRGKDGRPWAATMEPLAAAMNDAKLPGGVRVAAAAGLARHVDAGKAAGAADPALAQAVLKPLLEVITTPVSGDAAAGNWLVARALDMLPTVEAQASPTTAAALMAILADAARPVDVRVRAAAALGAAATPAARLDANEAIAKIRSLAAEALKADLVAATERSLTARLSGQPIAPAMQPGFEGMQAPGFPGGVGEFGAGPGAAPPDDPMEVLVVRRDAWRLWKLATAIATPDGAAGLAALLDEAAATRAKTVSATLREAATSLDASPDTAAVKQALVAIERLAQAAAPSAPRPAAAPGAPAAPAAGDPFGAGN